jgi:hypothetical protein
VSATLRLVEVRDGIVSVNRPAMMMISMKMFRENVYGMMQKGYGNGINEF